jgi:hypothetical protein
MPDTAPRHGGIGWPRRYTPTEIDLITKSLGLPQLNPCNIERLQRAAEAYQWASLSDQFGGWVDEDKKDGSVYFSATNEGRHAQITRILKLCAQGASADDIQNELNKLDARGSKLIGRVCADDPRHLQRAARRVLGAARRALRKIPRSKSDPQRARRQFIGNLALLYTRVTGRRASRRVREEKYTPLRTSLGDYDTYLKDYGPFLDL